MTQILDMAVENVALPAVSPYPNNPRKGNLGIIASSLEANGQYRPIVVQRSTGHILAGNNTYLAARELGWTEMAVQYVDVDDDTARRIVAVDNRSSDAAEYDTALLAELLSDLDTTTGTGYTDAEVDDIITSLSESLDTLTEPDEHNETPAPIRDPFPTPNPTEAAEPEPDTEDDDPEPDNTNDGQEEPNTPDLPEPTPVAEMILAFTPPDRAEAAQLIAAIRDALDEDGLKSADIVLRALRVLVTATDARHTPDTTVSVAELLRNAQ